MRTTSVASSVSQGLELQESGYVMFDFAIHPLAPTAHLGNTSAWLAQRMGVPPPS